MKIEHLTRKDYLTINPYSGINAVKKQLLEYSAIVVQDEEQFYGVLTTKDIVQNPRTLIIDCLTIKTLIDCEFTVEQTLSIMKNTQTDVLPVGKYEKMVGLVFKNDLYNYLDDYNAELERKIKERTQELEHAIASRDMMFSIIAHDLKSPFISMLGYLDILIKNIQKYGIDKVEKQLSTLSAQAKNAYSLLDNLLSWAKSNTRQFSCKPALCNISIICQEVIELLKDTAQIKDIQINCFYPAELNVYADKNMAETILRNILSNAIKFTKPTGKIDIYATPNNQFIEITVSDDGVGINERDRLNLFNPDSIKIQMGTANEKGTGLGLIICKDFVEKNGGQIWVGNKSERGTEVKFTLPKYNGQDNNKLKSND